MMLPAALPVPLASPPSFEQVQILEVGGERKAAEDGDGINALIGVLDVLVAKIRVLVAVVALAADEQVVADAALQAVVAIATAQRIVVGAAVEEIDPTRR